MRDKSKQRKFLILALAMAVWMFSLPGNVQVAKAAAFSTQTWRVVEIPLTSTKSYANPYLDVDVSAMFSGPGGVTMTMPGFWDGGNSWKVRFAPPTAGNWTYATTSSDTTNGGLHNQTGSISVTAYTGTLDIYEHGFLKPSSNNRYLAHWDGTPFFWLGDTHWFGLSDRLSWNSSNSAAYPNSAFKQTVDKRISQGFNVFQTNLFLGEWGDNGPTGTKNEGGHPWFNTGLSSINTTTYEFDGGNVSSLQGGISSPKSWRFAMDGNSGSKWIAANNSYPQWYVIDLGSSKTLSKVDTTFGNSDTWKYRIEGSTDNSAYTTLVDRTAGVTGTFFSDATTATARYVRISITGATGSSTASLAEFRPYDSAGNACYNKGLFKEPNPAFWQNVDQRIQYLSDAGMVTAVGLDWARYMSDSSFLNDYKRVARYVVARYGAYPTVWMTSGEVGRGDLAQWSQVASYAYSLDPYQRANSIHNEADNNIRWHDQAWYGFVALQGAHGSLKDNNYWLNQYNAAPTKPILESEMNYDGLAPGYYVRESAWKAAMNGSFGYTYGTHGGWQDQLNGSDCWQGCGSNWDVALDLPSGEWMKHYKNFFSGLNWSETSPSSSRISWTGAPVTGTAQPAVRAKSDGSIVIAHLPSTSATYTGTVNGLNASNKYSAYWYDPMQGTYTTISGAIAGASTWSVPAQPSASQDWVLLVLDNALPQPAGSVPMTKIDDTNAGIAFSGTWNTGSPNAGYYNSTIKWSTTASSYAEYTFAGTSVKWHASKNNGQGKADVYIDGVLDATVDLYSASSTASTAVFSKSGLSNASHTIRVVVRGDKNASSGNYYVTVDAFEYGGSSGSGDTTAPAAVTNLAVASTTSSAASLTWTAPGDDGSTGTATAYDIRYSTSPITPASWASATQAAGEPSPAEAGTSQSFTVTGLSASTTYYFAMKTSDEVPNVSGLSNVPSGTTTASSTIDDTNAGVAYSGTWNTGTPNAAYYNSTIHWSTTAGSFAEYAFTGTSVKWYASKKSDQGKADVYLDGTLDATVDLYSSSSILSAAVYSKTGLSNASHTIKVVVRSDKNASSGNYYVTVDAFEKS